MNERRLAWYAFALVLSAGTTANAQEFSPRWQLSGRGLLSSPFTLRGDAPDADWDILDFADTHLNTRFDNALFDETIGGFALGVRLTDQDSPLWPVFIYQVEGAVQGEHFVLQAGRTRRPSLGVTMPTLRDEDLLEYVYPLNPYSAGGLEEDVLFTDMLALTIRADFRWHAQIFLESLRNTTRTGSPSDAAALDPNSLGVRVFFDELPSLSRVRFIKHAELGVLAQRADEDFIPELQDDLLWQVTGSFSSNLYPDPIHLIDVRAAAVYQHGVDGEAWAGTTDQWRGRYVSGALALRYLYAPYQLDRFQASVSFAVRQFTDRDSRAISVVPNILYRLGQNVDLLLQYLFTYRTGDLAMLPEAQSQEHRIELAFSYSFSVSLNDTINLPRDLLNADYNYVPVN
ncbi:MAG: hypothetical protein RLP09_28620 [Sandaracinaceae bacterium]